MARFMNFVENDDSTMTITTNITGTETVFILPIDFDQMGMLMLAHQNGSVGEVQQEIANNLIVVPNDTARAEGDQSRTSQRLLKSPISGG